MRRFNILLTFAALIIAAPLQAQETAPESPSPLLDPQPNTCQPPNGSFVPSLPVTV